MRDLYSPRRIVPDVSNVRNRYEDVRSARLSVYLSRVGPKEDRAIRLPRTQLFNGRSTIPLQLHRLGRRAVIDRRTSRLDLARERRRLLLRASLFIPHAAIFRASWYVAVPDVNKDTGRRPGLLINSTRLLALSPLLFFPASIKIQRFVYPAPN